MNMRRLINLVESARVAEDFEMNVIDLSPAKRKQAKPLAALAPESDAFKAWFGKSKIVDRAGNPLPVYHGRKSDFTSFDPSKAKDYRPNTMFFSTDPYIAASYSGQHTSMTGHRKYKDGANVMPLYLRILRPLVINARGAGWNEIWFKNDDWTTNELANYAREKKYDGLVVKNVFDTGEGLTKPSTVIVAFSQNQVKSVFNGTWNQDSDHVNEKIVYRDRVITESRDAPLYHATSFENAIEIIHDNAILDRFHEMQKTSDGSNATAVWFGNYIPNRQFVAQRTSTSIDVESGSDWHHKVSGVNLTRDVRFALSWDDVVFALDQRLLTFKHKILPLDHVAVMNMLFSGNAKWQESDRSESLEIVLGPIRNLSRYLLWIYADPSVRLKNPTAYAKIAEHPKFTSTPFG